MRIARNEIWTGLLVLVTLAVLVAVLLALGAPGVFKPVKVLYVYFDNAGGVKHGSPVHLAGRRVGQVADVYSPVPLDERPLGDPKFEVKVKLHIASDARIYQKVRVQLQQWGLLGEMVIDFTLGDPASGLAPEGQHFVGERTKSLGEAAADALKDLTPLLEKGKEALTSLEQTSDNIAGLTEKGSDFDLALKSFRVFTEDLSEISAEEGALRETLENLERITTDLADNRQIQETLDRFQDVARNVGEAGETLNQAIFRLEPELREIMGNTRQLTDTVKRQPWRLIWPSTKSYPEEEDEAPADRERATEPGRPQERPVVGALERRKHREEMEKRQQAAPARKR